MVKIPKRKPIKLPVNYDKTHYTERMVVRAEYVRIQEGLCYHCKEPLDEESGELNFSVDTTNFPDHFYDHPIHLHHCHKTGLTLGAVRAHCNAVLWQYYGI